MSWWSPGPLLTALCSTKSKIKRNLYLSFYQHFISLLFALLFILIFNIEKIISSKNLLSLFWKIYYLLLELNYMLVTGLYSKRLLVAVGYVLMSLSHLLGIFFLVFYLQNYFKRTLSCIYYLYYIDVFINYIFIFLFS